jgi:RNA polymerase sigma-70 factor (ECF subfamily)
MTTPHPEMLFSRVTHRQDGPSTEIELLAQARRGTPSAIGTLYEAHAATLLRLGARITGSASDAEDLLHDLFVGLPELLGRYEHTSQLGPWLRGVMARMAIGRLRQAARRERLTSSNPTSDKHSLGDPWGAVDLDRAMSQLGETTRAVFVLRQIEGYSHDEIAMLLDITSGASRVRHLRALRQLRALLEPGS